MSREENPAIDNTTLADALARGMGRAVLMIEGGRRDRGADRPVVLNACLRDQRWDTQLEAGRARYLFDVLHATGEPEWYAAELKQVLAGDDGDIARYQVFELATLLVRGGIDWLRPAIYAAFKRAASDGDDIGAEDLISLDGARAYGFISHCFTTYPASEDERHKDEYLLDALIKRDGINVARQLKRQLLLDAPETEPYLRSAWNAWEKSQAQLVTMPKGAFRWPPVDYATVAADLAQPKPIVRFVRSEMDDESLRLLAADFNAETDLNRLKAYLRHFNFRTFPLPPVRLLELARGDSQESLTLHALRALEKVAHPTVHAFAREFLRQPGEEWRGVSLLAANPDANDFLQFEQLLEVRDSPTEWDYHRFGIALRQYVEAHPSPVAQASLLLLYENGPCSTCRIHAAELLDGMDAQPSWMKRELAYDAGR